VCRIAIDTGDTAWVLISSALVFVMTPGLAFFYAGLVRAKGALNIMMQNMMAHGKEQPSLSRFGA
jgi:Amt family ammonium transporter